MPSQCTLACLGTIVPCHSPTWALAVRRVLLSPPISEKVRFYGSFCFRLTKTTSSSLVKHAPHAVTMHARVSRHYRALPFPNLGARCKASLVVSTIYPKDPIVRVFFLSSRADGGDNGSAPPMTRFSRQSGCTRLRLDTFMSRRSLTAIAVRRLPFNMVSPSTKKIRSFGRIFVLAYFTGCLRVSLVFVYICILS